MPFVFLLAITGLTLSAVAIYYSVIGLTAIFAAAFWPIVIMGTTLEVSKLVAASWLKAKWNVIPRFMKLYMTTSVFVLMFITSMGIFGFLSKAHIEQTSMSTEQVAQIETLDDKITRSQAKINRWTGDLDRLNKGDDVRVDNLIANEQDGLDKIYARIKQEKDSLRADAKIKIDQQQTRITQAQDRRDKTIEAAEKKFKESFGGSAEYEAAVAKAKENEIAVASKAQSEILKVNTQLDKDLDAVDSKYKKDIADIQKRIQNLRNQANDKTTDIEGKIRELEGYIEAEQKKIDDAREEKFVYEKEYRKLEAEVGPVKYIAEFIYGEKADQTLLEKAVTWVIITIIFVFDPLAVLMLLASQMTYAWYKGQKDEQPTPSKPDPKPSTKYQDVIGKTYEGKGEPEPESQGFNEKDPLNEWNDMIEEAERAVKEEKESKKNSKKKSKKKTKKTVQKRVVEEPVEEFTEDDADDAFYLSSLQEPKQEPDEFDVYLENASNDEKEAMQRWKHETGHTLKIARKLFNQGTLEELPWMKYLHPEPDFVDETKDKQKVTWMEHDKEGHQIKKEGYKQNEEQNDDSIWQQIQKGKE